MVRREKCVTSLGKVAPSAAAGFSLVELIMVIVITGIIASVVGIFIAGPIRAFFDQARRAELVDAAQLALLRMGRDLRAALPNSIRVTGGALELLLTVDGDRYRAEGAGTADDRLDFTSADTHFNTLAPLDPPAAVPVLGGSYNILGALAIYPLQATGTGANPYVATDRVMTAFGTHAVETVANPGGAGFEYRVRLATPHRFRFDSPNRRVYLVRWPVSYVCDGGELRRYDGYPLQETQVATAAGLDAVAPPNGIAVVARHIESCGFDYAPGTAERNAVVAASLTLAQAGERVRLLRQVLVDNTP